MSSDNLSTQSTLANKSQSANANIDDDISIKGIILKTAVWYRYLLSKWLIILIAVVAGIIAGGIYSLITKPLYRAELTFVYGESGGSNQMGGLSNLASQFGIGLGGGNSTMFDGQNLVEFMKSRKIMQNVLLHKVNIKGKTLSIADEFIEVYKYREKWREKKSKFADISFNNIANPDSLTLNQNIVLGGIYNNIKAKNILVGKADKESNIMSISFKSENELLSKYFVEILAQEVSKYYIETKTKKAALNVAILQRQTDSVRRVLGNSIKGVATYVDINPNINASRKALLVPSQNKQVDVQANQAILIQLVQNLEIAKLSLRNETPLIQVIDAPVLPLDVIQISLVFAVVLGAIGGGIVAVLFLSIKMFFNNLLN